MVDLLIKASSTYSVAIGQGIIHIIANKLKELGTYNRVAVVTDSNVAQLYLDEVLDALKTNYVNIYSYVFPAGEKSKNISELAKIYDFLAENELTRSDVVIALGGGVVGDMVGYASATYLRGLDFVNIPTTLLAMVDSAVGGKTAVNIPSGKNLVGAFKQPKYVLCDTDFLATLDKGLIADGIGEVAKYAVLEDRGLFDLLLEGDLKANYNKIIELCVAIKADYVMNDEFDVGKRQLLNLGHTLAHVIEKDCNFTLHHGKAVLMGMYLLTEKYNFTPQTQLILDKLKAVSIKFDMDIKYEKSADELWSMAGNDKKRSGDFIVIARPYAIGDCRLEKVAVGCPLNYSEKVQKSKFDIEISNNRLLGTLDAPPSKSHAHRLLIASSFLSSKDDMIRVENVSYSDDILATLNALTALGYDFEKHYNYVLFKGNSGICKNVIIDCGECGSTLRFFIPICAMLGVKTTFIGSKRLGERGYTDIIKALQNVEFDKEIGLPLTIQGRYADKSIDINGNTTSQFITGLMLGAMAVKGKLTINIIGNMASKSYVDITAQVIKQFGGDVVWNNQSCIIDCTNLQYDSNVYTVDSDYSNGAFYNVAGVHVNYNNHNSLQGDKAILNIIEQAKINGYIDCDIDSIPDLMPIIAVLASTLEGKSIIRNCARLRIKESDRLGVMQQILYNSGVDCEIVGDNLLITGGVVSGGVTVDSCGDHRIAMATAILSTFAKKPITLTNAQNVAKSYPNFWEDFVKVGGWFNVINIR